MGASDDFESMPPALPSAPISGVSYCSFPGESRNPVCIRTHPRLPGQRTAMRLPPAGFPWSPAFGKALPCDTTPPCFLPSGRVGGKRGFETTANGRSALRAPDAARNKPLRVSGSESRRVLPSRTQPPAVQGASRARPADGCGRCSAGGKIPSILPLLPYRQSRRRAPARPPGALQVRQSYVPARDVVWCFVRQFAAGGLPCSRNC
ncbi:hypothetical protein SDC9_127639 [bioreactor metagenome]|uniref:Uncharacterized protein n=1 Tax=bioreactor metagenome TaxID=1076179 RepID=A0A645CTZ4_9ZZZZ